jgi:plasmid stabilization system protein ParE
MEDGVDWYSARSAEAAGEFIRNVRATITIIRKSPRLWALGKDNCRQAPVQKYPYRVIYQEIGGLIEIVAIAHASRRPGYWRDRLNP